MSRCWIDRHSTREDHHGNLHEAKDPSDEYRFDFYMF